MTVVLLSILGAFINRCRGGLINKLAWNTEAKQIEWTNFRYADKLPTNYSPLGKRIGKYGNALVFGIVAGFLIGSLYASLAAVLGMFIGSSFGWGKYMGGIATGTFDPNEKEIEWIDKLVMQKTDHARLRSIVAFGLRGLIWTSCIAVSVAYWDLNYLLYAPIGLLMGVVYYVTIIPLPKSKTVLCEWVWGAILWGSFALI